jgi:Tol biopolymer transport system component
MPLRLRLTPYSTLYLCVLATAIAAVTSWASFTAYTAKLDKHSPSPASANVKQATHGKTKAEYGDLPLSFELNRGQADGTAKFLARGAGYNIFLTATETALVLPGSNPETETSAVNESEIDSDGPTFHPHQIEKLNDAKATPPLVVRMKLEGASLGRVEGVQELPGKVNYFIGDDATKWLTDIPTFRKVAYRNVYEGIDAVYYGNRQQLEYDLVIAPGADPNVIKIKYEGAESLRVDSEGTLRLKTRAGEIQQPKPLIYQQENGQRKVIEGRYVMRGGKRVGFNLGKYDRRKPLVIDPKLIYLSLVNGSGYGYTIAVDANGSAYIAGEVFDGSLSPTGGAFQTNLSGGDSAFVTKLNTSGTSVVYSTYLGGSGGAYAYGIAVDGQGNAYVTGGAGAGFPTTAGVSQTTNRGGSDSFVTKLNPAGSALVYSTFYGGNNYDEGDGIAVDAAGNAYVGGIAASTDLITTAGAPQSANAGGYEGFAIKLNPSGAVQYATYFGGGGADTVNGTIAIDSSGNAYIAGQSSSFNLPQVNSLMAAGGLNRGIFKSTNSGSTWSLSTNGLQTSTVSALVVDRNASNTIYAATVGGVSKSTDAGLNWSNTGAIYPNGLAIAMGNSSTIYVGTDFGINKTTNAGTNWTVSYSGLTVRALTVDPSNSAIVYAGGTEGVLKSTNSGASWTPMNSGLTPRPVRSIVIDPTNTSIIYVCAGTTANSRVYKSTNSGTSWALASTGLPSTTILSLAIDPISVSTLYAGTNAGMYKTTNGGTNWSVINNGLSILYTDNVSRTPAIAAVAVSNPSSTLYATSSSSPTSAGAFPPAAVFKSTDSGATWTLNATGLVGGNLVSLAVDPNDATKIYVGNAGDVDAFFIKVNSTGTAFLNATYVGSSGFDSGAGVAVDSSDSPYILGYTQGSNFQTTGGAFQTTRAGISDTFVVKLNSSGNQISYSTLLGGLDSEFTIGGIAVNASGNAFVTGYTASSNFPTTAGSFQRTFGSRSTAGSRDSFVTELNSTGTGLVYSSYLGGPGDEPGSFGFFGSRLALDPTGNTYLVGTTNDTNTFPYFDNVNGFNSNGTYVAKIDPNTPTFSITGRLTTPLNVGIAGIYVQAEGPTGVFHYSVTDVQGYYSLFNLPAGDYTVTPNKCCDSQGRHYVFNPGTRTFNNLSSDQIGDFTGTQVFDITGQITSSVVSGQGLFDIPVTLSGSASASVVTDVFGTFRFEDLPTGNYTVTPTKPGFVFSPTNATYNNLSADQFPNFTTASATFFTISGHVADGSNAPISGVAVTVRVQPQFGYTTLPAVQTDASGNYSFSNLQAGGNYNLTPAKPLLTFNPISPTVSNLSANQAVNFTGTTVTGLTGKIAFVKFGQAPTIATMNADGTGETNLITLSSECSTDESGPAWSPDGSRIAFSGCNQFGTSNLYLMGSDGSNATQLTNVASDDVFPNWSPDGTRLTFSNGECSGADNQIPEVFTIDIASKVRSQLTNNNVVDATSNWSPNGSSITFFRGTAADCSGSDFLGDIYTITPQGTNETRLTNANALSYLPAYSPDGSKIAFVRETEDVVHNVFVRNIYIMNADGTNQIKITPDSMDAVKPSWSPDGSKIAFSADFHSLNYSAIFVVNPDGTGLAQITENTTAGRELPDWQHLLLPPSPTPTPTPAPGVPSTSNLFGVLSGFVDVNQSGDFAYFGAGQSAVFLRRASDGLTTRLYQMSDPMPGLPGTTRGELLSGSPRINNSGKVAFATDYIANATFQRVILVYDGSSLTPIINSTDVAPNSGGATYGRTITLGGLNNSGDIAFTAIPNGVTTLYIVPNGGASVRIAGPGDTAPGTGGTLNNIALANGANSLSDNSGEVAFTAQIVGGSGGFGVFVGSTTGVRKVVANGDAIPGGGTYSILSAPVARLNRFGQVAFVANNATSNSTIWMHTPATGIVKAVSNGDAAPAALGGTLSAPTLAAFNDNPYVAFTATVTGSGVTPRGVFRVNPGSAIETVAFANQAAPGASPATFSTFAGVSMDNVAGTVSFQSTLTGGSVGHGLFRQSGVSSPVSIVLDAASAAVPGGGTFNLTNTTRSRTLDDGKVYSFANVFGSTTTYAEFLADTSSITILMNDGTALPAGSRTSQRNFRVGAAGDYISFLGQSTGGRRSLIIRNIVTGIFTTLVTEGDSAPGGGRLRFTNSNVTYVNASGTVAFAAQIIGGPLGVSTGIFTATSSGTITKVVADGDVDPNSGSTFSAPSLNSLPPSPLNNAGQVVFRATVLSKLGIYVYSPASPIARIAQNGDAAPGGGTFNTPSSVQAINSFGQVAFFSTTSGGPASNQGIFVGAPGGAVTQIVVSGLVVPNIGVFSTFPNVGYSFNDSGEVAFKAALNSGNGVFVGSATSGIQAIALNGNFSSAGATYNTAVNADVLINNEHDVVFQSALTGGSTDSAYFLRRGPAGFLQVIAVQGQPAPGTNGTFVTIFSTSNNFPGENFALGPTGEVAFTNTVQTSNAFPFGEFRYRTDNLLEKIVARGDIVPGTNGGTFSTAFGGMAAGGPGHFAFWVPVLGGSVDDLIYVTNSPAVAVTPSSLKITGRIVDTAGNPINGLTVNLAGTTTGSTQTDGTGNFSFMNLASGNYTVSPSSAVYAFAPANYNFNLTVDHVCVFVATQTAVSIGGKITDSNNTALNGVTVALTKNGAPAGTAQTNAQGDYTFASLTPGDLYVVTPSGSFTPSSQTFANLTTNATANFKSSPTLPPQCTASSFAAPNNIAVGTFLISIRTGDFNADGKLDLAVANQGSSSVSILLGTGAGTFGAPTNFTVGTNPQRMAVGDFNRDGKLDLAVANSTSNNVSILLGTGLGTFSAATNFGAGALPVSVAIGDFNSDGKADLAVANGTSNNVSILLGAGDGSFSGATNFSAGSSPQDVAAGDFNVDGKLDLAVANSTSNNVSILLGTGTGSFGAATNFATASGSRSVAVGDFNSDGIVDLAVANGVANNISILLGSGTGSFSAATNFTVAAVPSGLVVGDFNGDGKLDVAAANNSGGNTIAVLLGTGTGNFSPAANVTAGLNPLGITVGDFNGDNKLDLATSNRSGDTASILLNSGTPCTSQPSLTISGRVADAMNHSLPEITVTLSGPVSQVTQTDSSGNYSFPNLTPGGNYTVTVQTPYYVVLPARIDFFNLTSSQTVNFVAAALAVPVPSPPPSDNFNTAVRDATKWSVGTQTEPAQAFDPQVTSAQVNGQLVITPLTQAVGMHYAGYVSASSFDMRNSKVSVELVQAATGGADSIFSIGSSANDFFRFMVHTAGVPTSLAPRAKGFDGVVRELDNTVSQLIFQVSINGVITSQSINYDKTQHRFLRFRNEVPGPNQPFGAIVFEASPASDFSPISFQFPVALTKALNPLTAELSAGTSNPTNPGQTIFDNYGLVTSTFQFSTDRYSVAEGAGSVLITVTRAGSIGDAATVHFETGDDTATQVKNYLNAIGTLSFAPQETTKTFTVPIVDNALPEGNLTLNLFLGNPVGSGLNTPGRAVITIIDNDTTDPGPTTPLLQMVLEQPGPSPNQAAALDAILLIRDPFPVINSANVVSPGADPNTRVILFVINLQMAQGEAPSAVVVNLVDETNHSYAVAAEQVQTVTNFPFTEVIFRLPDTLPVGTCTVSVKAHGQTSNVGTIRIRN